MQLGADAKSLDLTSDRSATSTPPLPDSHLADSRQRIPELDGLRGLAILLVLLYHYVSFLPVGRSMPLLRGLFAIGWSGVDLFFVLSGFLIGGILLDVRDSPKYFRTFYGRRFYRIVPLYYVWVGIFFLLAVFRPQSKAMGSFGVYLLFLQNFMKTPRGAFNLAWLGALWSLAVEEQFYLVCPTVVRLLPRRRLVVFLIATIACAPLLRVLFHVFLVEHPAAPYVLTPCRADALALGVALALGWRSEACRAAFDRLRPLVYAVSLSLFAGFLYLAIRQPSQYTLTMHSWGFSVIDGFFASLLAVAIMAPKSALAAACRLPFLRELGRVSYCLYVIHDAVNLGCHKLLLHSLPHFDSWKSALVSIGAAFLAYGFAVVSWKFFEHPLLKKGHALRY